MQHSRACNRPATTTQFSLEMCVNYNTTILKHLCKICKDFITYNDKRSHGSNLHRVATFLSNKQEKVVCVPNL